MQLRCPGCRREVVLDEVGQDLRASRRDGSGHVEFGQRRCPSDDCGTLIFVLRDGEMPTTYPAETVDFDATGLPPAVLTALDESIKCHAHQCYVAAAIMVRKTIEEICADQSATGKTLYERVEELGNKVALPKPMLQALHDLRLLGNDAAHIELSDFNGVGFAEASAALSVAKEILKATYQYESIMSQLNALKKQSAAAD